MSEYRSVLERASASAPSPDLPVERVLRRRDRKLRDQRIRAGVVGLMVAVAIGWWGLHAIRSTPPIPANPPEEPSVDLGIFEPVAGRIVFHKEGIDRRYDAGLWAVDPNSPSVSTLVRLGSEGDMPLGWSSDGTELLLMREDRNTPFPYEDELFILHADGSETQLNTDTRYIEGATISPDGSRVVFAAAGGPYFPYNHVDADPGLFVVDTDGGRPVPIPYPSAGDRVSSPTFSPDGTQIAYLVEGFGDDDNADVWVADADGSNAHEILADEPAVTEGVYVLAWSPSGDRIAMDNSLGRVLEIYTFAPDGSDFTTVITGGMNPVWSPDGSQIAYMVPYDPPRGGDPPGLAIADADGSNVRQFGLAMSGPWHPATGVAQGVLDPPREGEVVHGWPDTSRNQPGVYSWDGSGCGVPSETNSCVVGFMHNGYGSGDVEILLEVVYDEAIPDDGATAAIFAGHDGFHRRIDAFREEWIVDIEGTMIRIRLNARPGTSQADLADAHAIIDSMRAESQDSGLGFRLVFTLTTNDWDSG